MNCCVACVCGLQLAGAAGGSIVRGLSGLDSWLEGNKLLPELKPREVPEAVQDEDGQLNEECQEVRDRFRGRWLWFRVSAGLGPQHATALIVWGGSPVWVSAGGRCTACSQGGQEAESVGDDKDDREVVMRDAMGRLLVRLRPPGSGLV